MATKICRLFPYAVVAVIVEADYNPALCYDVRNMLQRNQETRRCRMMYECKSDPDRPGVFKPKDAGLSYVRAFNTVNQTDRLFIAAESVMVYTGTYAEATEELLRQVGAYQREQRTTGKGGFSNTTVVYSGKSAGNDDAIVAVCMAIRFGCLFMASSNYLLARGKPNHVAGGMSLIPQIVSTSDPSSVRADSSFAASLYGTLDAVRRE